MLPLDLNSFLRRWCIVGILMGSTLSTIIGTILTKQQSYYYVCGEKKYQTYQSTCFVLITMSLAMMTGIPISLIFKRVQENQAQLPIPKKILLMLPLVSIFDILESFITMFLINGINAYYTSITSIMVIITLIIFRYKFLNKEMYAYMWVSVVLALCSIICVAIPAIITNKAAIKSAKVIVTVIFICILDVVLRAGQITLEEYILHNSDMNPEMFTGIEGCCNLLLVLFIFCPIVHFIPLKDVQESVCQTALLIIHSRILIFTVFIHFIILGLFNFCRIRFILYTNALSFSLYKLLAEPLKAMHNIITVLVPSYLLYQYHERNEIVLSIVFNTISAIFIVISLMLASEIVRIPCSKYPEVDKLLYL